MAHSRRVAYLDMLRAAASISVLITHMLERTSPWFQNFRFSVFDLGFFGVTLFFLCSGYVIPRSIERSDSIGSGVARFWVKRLLRLYPSYWLSVVLIACCYGAGLAWPPQGVTVAPSRILVQLTMLQHLFGQPNFLVVYWTLNYELAFYLAVSILFATRLLAHTEAIVVALATASVACNAVLPAFFPVPLQATLLSLLATMFCGTLVHRWRSGAVSGRRVVMLVSLIVLALCAVSIMTGIREGSPWARINQLTAYLAAWTVFAVTVLWEPKQIPSLFLWLGVISYPVYLLHPIVLAVVPRPAAAPLAWMLWTAVTIVAAALCHVWIERPGMTVAERLVAALSRRRVDRCSAAPSPENAAR